MIRVYKLVTGEDIITEIADVTTNVVCKSPAQILLQPTDRGMSVGLVPFMPFSTGDVEINDSAVVAFADADPDLENEYRRLFGSGLVVASAGSIR